LRHRLAGDDGQRNVDGTARSAVPVSRATPTISIHVPVSCSKRKRRPTALTAPKYRRAIVSLMTATRGVSRRSRSSIARPYRIGMRSASKKPGPAQIAPAVMDCSGSNAVSGTTTGVPVFCIGTPRVSAADCTPGIAATRRRSSSYTFLASVAW
jgi:hypothetical protein